MIQIIKGTFGYYDGRKVRPITEADGPQSFDPELEARLVKKGVAKYVGDPDGSMQQDPDPDGADELPEYSESMRLDELKEIAAAYGVNASEMRKKADVIAAIEATIQEQDADPEDPDDPEDLDPDDEDEAPPQPSVADPV